VTVGAHHLAASDLGFDGLARGGLRKQHGDARGLLADVVELEDQRIGLAAVHAGVVMQMLEDLRSQGLLARLLGGVRLASMRVAAVAEVGREA
jgi:hypothetical protein